MRIDTLIISIDSFESHSFHFIESTRSVRVSIAEGNLGHYFASRVVTLVQCGLKDSYFGLHA